MESDGVAAKPWMKFYPQDWRADERLRLCSLSARGLWLEMMAIMHRATPYGHLLIGGISPSAAQLATQVGAAAADVIAGLRELEDASVYSKDEAGVIYSRRMVRDHQKAETARQNGKNGGNPALKGRATLPSDNERDKGSDNPPLNPLDKRGLKAQRPEARGQSSAPIGAGAGAPIDPVKALFDAGVALLTDAGATPKAARSLIARWRQQRGEEWTMKAIAAAANKSDPAAWIEARMKGATTSEDDAAAIRRATIARYRLMDMPGPPAAQDLEGASR